MVNVTVLYTKACCNIFTPHLRLHFTNGVFVICYIFSLSGDILKCFAC